MVTENNVVNTVCTKQGRQAIRSQFTENSRLIARVMPNDTDWLFVKAWFEYGKRTMNDKHVEPRVRGYRPEFTWVGCCCVLAYHAGRAGLAWEWAQDTITDLVKV